VLNRIIVVMMFSTPLYAGGLVDPTKPGVTKSSLASGAERAAPVKPKWILKGIKIDGNDRSAIINQQSYRVGEVVGDQTIKQISPNQVIFSSGKRLSLFDDSFVSLAKKKD